MEIGFTKLSDIDHQMTVTRSDGSTESLRLNTRSFLNHDFAHIAAEQVLRIRTGFWGLVAGGASLDGQGLESDEIMFAESVAGPLQTLLRTEASSAEIFTMLQRVIPDRITPDLADELHERLRHLSGHWKATAYSDTMTVLWGEQD